MDKTSSSTSVSGAWMLPGHDADRVAYGDFADERDAGRLGSRGIMVAVLLAIPIWCALAFLVEWMAAIV